MSESIDPKELKILSDILALVLEDQPGQSSNALEAIRTRARRNQTTGGALKNLFIAIAPNPPQRPAARPRATRAGTATSTDMQVARAHIAQLTESLNRLDLDLRSTRARCEALRSELQITQQARAETQAALQSVRASRPTKRIVLAIFAFIVGTVLGIAGTELVHDVTNDPQPSNAVYLR
jgi:hypothetical protein